MWEDKSAEYKSSVAGIRNVWVYENNNLSEAPIINGVFIEQQVIFKFIDQQKALEFYKQFTVLPFIFTRRYHHNKISSIIEKYPPDPSTNAYIGCYDVGILQKCYSDDLEKLYGFLADKCCIPVAIMQEIQAVLVDNQKKLGDVEENFWERLLKETLHQANFAELFALAKQIVIASGNGSYQVQDALWKLAVKCKNEGLIEEWLCVLKEIAPVSHCACKAQEELAYYYLAIMGEQPNNASILFNGIIHIQGMPAHFNAQYSDEILDLQKRICLTFLGEEWQNQEIFKKLQLQLDQDSHDHFDIQLDIQQAGFIVNLLEHIKNLQKEISQLKQDVLKKRATSAPPAKSRSTLKFS